MKTKDLIALLQEADPSGEEFVCVNGCSAILGVSPTPAWYDGQLNYFTWAGKPGHREGNLPTGGVIKRTGNRIDITAESVTDHALDFWMDGLEFPIEVIGDTPDGRYAREAKEKRDKHFANLPNTQTTTKHSEGGKE